MAPRRQQAKLRMIFEDRGRFGLAWQATVDGDELFAGTLAEDSREFRFSYHADGNTQRPTGLPPSCGRCHGLPPSSAAGPGCGITRRMSGAFSRGYIGRCNGPPANRGNETRAPCANGVASAGRR